MSSETPRQPRQPHPDPGAQPAGGWQPTAQGGEYDSDATAFVQLPEGFLDSSDAQSGRDPLAAPGHGYAPPPIAPASADPSATGPWTMPYSGGQEQQGQYGQQPYSGYGYQQQPGYGMAQPYGYGSQPQGEHPQATSVLVLGILGFFLPIVSFIAWYLGGKAKKEVEAGAPYRFEGGIKIGYLLGKILSIVAIVGTVLFILLMMLGMGAMMTDM
ncbi:MAG TPA: hypothetical protein DEQ61_20705 [Streptomyces sp.]|nr:hypothetical protein [Streptomyces sp.]